MIDVEQRLRDELDLLAPPAAGPDWSEVLELAGRSRRHRRRRATAAIGAALVVVGTVLVATPLGAGIVHSLGGFSAWLTGQPGSPASEAEQQEFERANARSWLGFPAGTNLRRLSTVTDPTTGRTVDLFGFRSGSTLCLRVVASGKVRETKLSCAPLAELRQAGAPVRVVLVDHGFGQGTKRAWYGVIRFRAPGLQVTAGIVADGVRRVVVEDDSGLHMLRAISNAFLYVALDPDVGQRVKRIWAETDTARIRVPFAPVAFGLGGGPAQQRAPSPPRVERHVRGGTIGWLDRHEPRGEPLDVLPPRSRRLVRRHTVFGRVLAPDPHRPFRLALTLSTSRRGGKATGLCTWMIMRGGAASGGCAVRADAFARGPIMGGLGLVGGSDEFATVAGVVSDDVARLVAFLADGQRMGAPLADNTYLVDIARSRLPARLVAYDDAGRVIGFTTTIGDVGAGSASVRGRARLLLHAASPTGSWAKLYVGRSTSGGRCMYVRWYRNKHARGTMEGCGDPAWHGPPLQLSTESYPPEFVVGRVRSDVATVELRFADGARTTLRPTNGFVLYAVPAEHLEKGHVLVSAAGRNAAGRTVATQPFPRPGH
jgi:hypothetical protein